MFWLNRRLAGITSAYLYFQYPEPGNPGNVTEPSVITRLLWLIYDQYCWVLLCYGSGHEKPISYYIICILLERTVGGNYSFRNGAQDSTISTGNCCVVIGDKYAFWNSYCRVVCRSGVQILDMLYVCSIRYIVRMHSDSVEEIHLAQKKWMRSYGNPSWILYCNILLIFA